MCEHEYNRVQVKLKNIESGGYQISLVCFPAVGWVGGAGLDLKY